MEIGDIVKTKIDGDFFKISITEESDWSTDGGYTYEDVENTWELNKIKAKELIKELQEFIAT